MKRYTWLLCLLVLALLGLSGVVSWIWLPELFALVSLGMFIYVKRSKVLEPHAALIQGAGKLVTLLPARYVVMGHTHKPVMESLPSAATYVNLGNWTVDLLDDHAPKAPCSHLVIRHDRSGKPVATVYSWQSDQGATVMFTDQPKEAAADPAKGHSGSLQTQPVTPRS